jgi:hypothetical protein
MLIADENKDYTAANLPAGNNRYIIDNPEAPYLNQLASQYASATHEYSLFHPSFKNYLALLTGATISSGNVPTSAPTLVDQMSDAGIPWTAYVDGLNFPGAPSSCDPSATDQEVYDDVSPYYYEYDHNPFWYFTHITGSSECNNVVPYPGSTSLISTLDGPGAPDFVWISPNGCNDGHDATCQFNETESADLWLQGSTNLEGVTPTLMCPLYCLDLPSILSSSWYQSGGIIIITWDEAPNTDTSGGGLPDTDGGQIATLVISSTAQGGYTTPGNDYSILRAIQEAYGLTPLLGHAADPANGDLSGAFGQTVSAPPPSVTGVTPTDGPQGGGALVTINGTHFVGSGFSASDVLVGSRDIPVGNPYPCPGSGAGCFKVINATHISVFMPSTTSAASDDVSVMTPGGTSPTSAADEYTYIAPGAYTAVTPFRICDTRPPGSGIAANQCDTGSGRTLAAGNETITAQITSASGPVPLGAQAVVVNMTAINRSTGGTFITAFPAGGAAPAASNINLVGNTLGTNLATVQLNASGQLSVFNAVGSADVILDVQGYFAAPGGTNAGQYHSIPPLRICDTRANQGTACAGAANNPLVATTSAGAWRRVVLSGLPPGAPGGTASIPSTGASGAAFNLTATGGTKATFLAVQAPSGADLCPSSPPKFSNVNPSAGGSLPNRVISSLGPKEDICIFNAVGSINVIVDVDGWFGSASAPAGALFYSVPPTRICDTRAGSSTICAGAPLTAKAIETIATAGVLVVPAEGGSTAPVAIVANLTAVAGTAATYFTLYPSDVATPPRASDVNPVAGQVIANLAMVGLATTGAGAVLGNVNLYNAVGDINAILDVAGWFQ